MSKPSETIPAPPKMTAVDGGQYHGIQWCIVRAPLWGAVNGYVRVPDDRPWAGMGYDEVHEADPFLEVHGGLTFARAGWIGFDTLHAGDWWPGSPMHIHDDWCKHWTEDGVADEARNLAGRVALIAQIGNAAR